MIKVLKAAPVVACLAVGAMGFQAQSRQSAEIQEKLSLGTPIQLGTLAVVPIECPAPIAKGEYLTLTEATKIGAIEIIETPGQNQVNSLEVQNHAKMPILLFAGELLLGGKQDRIVAKDSIVPPLERRDVPVYCVEHGRWNGTPDFKGGNTLVPNAVRQNVIIAGGMPGGAGGIGGYAAQQQVWDSVAKSNSIAGAAPATGTLRGTLNDPTVQQHSEALLERLNSRVKPGKDTVGWMCWIDGKIESADVYANAALCEAGRSKLFRSYSLDVQLVEKPKIVPVDMEECRAFLKKIVSARRDLTTADRDGKTFSINTRGIQGQESGSGRFGGGFGGAGGGAGFGHGTYKPGGG